MSCEVPWIVGVVIGFVAAVLIMGSVMYYYYYQIRYNDQFRDKLICRIAAAKPANCIQRQQIRRQAQNQSTLQQQWRTIKQTYGAQSKQGQKFRQQNASYFANKPPTPTNNTTSQIDPASVVT